MGTVGYLQVGKRRHKVHSLPITFAIRQPLALWFVNPTIMPQQIEQIISDRYLDRTRIQTLMAKKFQPGTWSAQVSRLLAAFSKKHWQDLMQTC